ncbi:M16 family metallopeptidase [Paraglaciecola arctica]|uniref:M16 family metallopeptidase n=1 Tax=Paraglaciecola arctica TaxID=1128911 RepID=UPI001C079E46|nr:pitrilysin family protein [Paraglaciecola arctica]MBU3003974.1 insulinase family protein [Paraglaciecola arctica]
MKKALCYLVLLTSTFTTFHSISAQEPAKNPKFEVNYQKFVLDNGLEVVFHIDRSDPVVAVNLTAHVGSAREVAGRTGFAHLFEHLLFLESENLGKGGLDKLSARIGGSGANGSTSRDRTNYLQTIPKDALEKMIWAEADKLGWFINTVTVPVLEKEKQVVKNEKRQSSDNAPYGHNWYVIDQNLYPQDHPYNWQVIGSLADLQAATLDDVKQFFKRWYVPNNVTLTLAGDFDPVQAKQWVEKYFSEIKAGEKITPLKKRAAKLTETKKRYHEDNFANQPQITRTYPTVEQYHPDSYALNVLFEYLANGKSAPLYKVLVEDKQLVPSADIYHQTSELAGQAYLIARAYGDIDLDQVNSGIGQAFKQFEKDGISEQDLQRILATQETDFYNQLSSVLGKGAQLAYYNIYTGDPGYAAKEIEAILSVTTDDVKRVYNQYIKNKHYVVTSFVPKGKLELAVQGSTKAKVTEEQVVQGAEKQVDPNVVASYSKTPSTFDRSKEPKYGQSAEAIVPNIWQAQLDKIQVLGIEVHEVPLVDVELVIDGGQLFEPINKVGMANILAQMLTSGTKNKSPEALENAIKLLGASISVSANKEDIRIRVNTLAKNYEQTMDLVTEILLEPRWDKKEFTLIKQQTLSQIRQQQADPRSIANNTFNELIYGENNIRAKNILGNKSSVEAISLEDIQDFYRNNLSPNLTRIHVVGAIDKKAVLASMSTLKAKWPATNVTIPKLATANRPTESKVYFYDVPGAKQTVVNIGYPALAATNKDYYPATIMNYILGGGSFASQLTQELREGKGYTYGIFSGFSGTKDPGTFRIFSQVRSNVTLESAQLIKTILENYGKNYSQQDLATSKSFLIKSNARAFETANAKLGLLDNISKYNWPQDYVKQREKTVNNIKVKDIKALANKYLLPNQMVWLFVGDANTQLARMKTLGFGEPVLLNPARSH